MLKNLYLRFLNLVFIEHLRTAFANGLLFSLLKNLNSDCLKYCYPYKHNRLTTIIGLPIYLGSPYFKVLRNTDLAYTRYNWF